MSDPQLHIKIWLRDRLTEHGSKKALAAALGIGPDAVTRILETDSPVAKSRRQIKQEELPIIARHLNELPPGYENMTQWLKRGAEVEDPVEATREDLRAVFKRLPLGSERLGAIRDLLDILAGDTGDPEG